MTLGEFAFIETLLRPLAAGSPGALDLGDDAGLIDPPPGASLVVTKDAMVAGRHFLDDDPADLVARKLLRVNLSDLAAMGAEPLCYLLALIRPPSIDDAWLEAFTRGLAEDQGIFGIGLLGGDTAGTPGPLTLSLTAIGHLPKGRALRRDAARAGDLIVVSGTLGDGFLGLQVLKGALAADGPDRDHLIGRYRLPEPRMALGRRLRGLAHACIDVSDGLAADLGHILERSQVGAVIEAARVPLSTAARPLPGAREAALTGGDDYELLFTVPAEAEADVAALALGLDVPLTVLGRITAELGLRVLDEAGNPLALAKPGWTHF